MILTGTSWPDWTAELASSTCSQALAIAWCCESHQKPLAAARPWQTRPGLGGCSDGDLAQLYGERWSFAQKPYDVPDRPGCVPGLAGSFCSSDDAER